MQKVLVDGKEVEEEVQSLVAQHKEDVRKKQVRS